MAAQSSLVRKTIGEHEFFVAPLEVVSLQKLGSNDPAEVEKLAKACKNPGFFHLNLDQDSQYLHSLETIYKVAGEYFHQTEDVKMKDYRESQDRGFKPGEAETFEVRSKSLSAAYLRAELTLIKIAREEIQQKLPCIPDVMSGESAVIEEFISASHQITLTILSHLSSKLNLPHLADFHLDGRPNDCGLKIESVPMEEKLEDVPPSEHTDNGTITLLFCPDYTTELRVPGSTDTWGFIEPKPGHAIVNVANSLQTLSKQELFSCLHRVGQPLPGAKERFCVLYYLRPENQRELKV